MLPNLILSNLELNSCLNWSRFRIHPLSQLVAFQDSASVIASADHWMNLVLFNPNNCYRTKINLDRIRLVASLTLSSFRSCFHAHVIWKLKSLLLVLNYQKKKIQVIDNLHNLRVHDTFANLSFLARVADCEPTTQRPTRPSSVFKFSATNKTRRSAMKSASLQLIYPAQNCDGSRPVAVIQLTAVPANRNNSGLTTPKRIESSNRSRREIVRTFLVLRAGYIRTIYAATTPQQEQRKEQIARRAELVSLRGSIKRRITKFKNYLEKSGPHASKDYIEKQLHLINNEYVKLPELTVELETLEPEGNHAENAETVEDDYEEIQVLVRKFNSPHLGQGQAITRQTSSTSTIHSQPAYHDYLKTIPRMEAKKFDGKIENWRTYRDWFVSTIHKRECLTDSERLDILKRTLEGEALATIEGFAVTDENFDVAWELLKDIYDVEWLLILRHFDLLMETPSMKKNSSGELRRVLNHVQTHALAMKALGENIEAWNTPLVHIILKRLHHDTYREWNRQKKGKKMPNYQELLEFLREESTKLTDVSPKSPINGSNTSATIMNKRSKNNRDNMRTQVLLTDTGETMCRICKEDHAVDTCAKLLALSTTDRIQAARQARLCLNCLTPGHKTRTCKEDRCDNTQRQPLVTLVASLPSKDLIVTAIILVFDNQGTPIKCRAVLDTGSTTNFMTGDLAKRLRIPMERCSIPISAIGSTRSATNYLIKARIQSRVNAYSRTLNFLTVSELGGFHPNEPIDRSVLQIPKNITLADPHFDRPAPADMLLSAGTTLSLLCQGQIKLDKSGQPDLIIQSTQLGWIIGGSVMACKRPQHISSTSNLLSDAELNIEKFWELEALPKRRFLSKEEEACEKYFKLHTYRDHEGKYVVSLPFNEKKPLISASRIRAERMLKQLLRKFTQNEALEKQYRDVMQEYIDLGHMSLVNEAEARDTQFYMPHHAVFKTTSLTTKVRVVFNASAKSGEFDTSLNDALITGPTIQDDIFSLLIRFRTHQYVLTGDVEKMYRQFWVNKDDRKYQRILWVDVSNNIQTYELNTVTFGVASAPFLAIRCLQQLASDEGHDYPEAALRIQRDMYVDDLLTGADNKEDLIKIREDINFILTKGHLNMRQWASNDPGVLKGLPETNVNMRLQGGDDATIKVLGLYWNSNNDSMVYTVEPIPFIKNVTKRKISSDLAKIFDPLGLVGPVIMKGKIILQQLWKEKLGWDDPVPLSIYTEWKTYLQQLPLLNNTQFQRKTILSEAIEVQLHGFCDASDQGYGACVYLRTTDRSNETQTYLLCAKSRVAPINKKATIPRLELCSALLLAELVESVENTITQKIPRRVLWSDSMIALHWINTPPHKLTVFVANRVSGILEKCSNAEWRHVRTNDNPADHISRGCLPEDFTEGINWKTGPKWLNSTEDQWPESKLLIPPEVPEMRKVYCLLSITHNRLLSKFSCIGKLRRVMALFLRLATKKKGPITVDEIQDANDHIIRLVQAECFNDELRMLKQGNELPPKHRWLAMSPYLDAKGLIRVGGRLRNANIKYSEKHPLILPKHHHVVDLLIRHEHLRTYHAGAQTTLYSLRRNYWILDARQRVRYLIRNCTQCIRAKPPPTDYIMGNLPAARVTEARPFLNVGVDYCGPFYLKEKKHRNRNKIKVWVSVFVCFVVKAVHLEVESDLTTEGFIAAFKRFTSRRGKPMNVYSDNGKNFVGAANEIKELYSFLQSETHNEIMHRRLANDGIEWHFIPPRAPHVGGLWEACVKSFKHHLYRITDCLVTFEEFNTLVIEIESILNSRPLTPMSSDPHDPTALSPAHFLIGDSLTSIPETDFTEISNNRLSSWEVIQRKKQEFWKRWYKEYLNEQNRKNKWTHGQHNIREGTLVILREDNVPPKQWILGRVIKVFPGSDGVTRTVRVKTTTGEFDRNVRKLTALLTEDEDSNLVNSIVNIHSPVSPFPNSCFVDMSRVSKKLTLKRTRPSSVFKFSATNKTRRSAMKSASLQLIYPAQNCDGSRPVAVIQLTAVPANRNNSGLTTPKRIESSNRSRREIYKKSSRIPPVRNQVYGLMAVGPVPL
ncbi:uncharacterized protein LOC135159938 [Diachasmimorpha longicaudata]|uniref:uncharacterized protein LOC135159938 n=1 Tax=Diachasmimorpha longicaudata TaxID=58733 RepID=UPI0030B8AEEB